MSYVRVIPRDLFNEANLLKCLGQLVLLLERRDHTAFLDEPIGSSPFRIEQDSASGAISVTNLPFTIQRKPWRLTRPLNSRQPWPLYAESEDGEQCVAVFEEDGLFTQEFLALIAEPE